jgi:hypothetical protein
MRQPISLRSRCLTDQFLGDSREGSQPGPLRPLTSAEITPPNSRRRISVTGPCVSCPIAGDAGAEVHVAACILITCEVVSVGICAAVAAVVVLAQLPVGPIVCIEAIRGSSGAI